MELGVAAETKKPTSNIKIIMIFIGIVLLLKPDSSSKLHEKYEELFEKF
jgi:hypothetical protein